MARTSLLVSAVPLHTCSCQLMAFHASCRRGAAPTAWWRRSVKKQFNQANFEGFFSHDSSSALLRCWSPRVWGNMPRTPNLCRRPSKKSQTPARWPLMRWTAPPVTSWTAGWTTEGGAAETSQTSRTRVATAPATTAMRSRPQPSSVRRTWRMRWYASPRYSSASHLKDFFFFNLKIALQSPFKTILRQTDKMQTDKRTKCLFFFFGGCGRRTNSANTESRTNQGGSHSAGILEAS